MRLLDRLRRGRVSEAGPTIFRMDSPAMHFKNSPITEAILDLRVESKMRVDDDDLAKCQRPFRSEYPTKDKLQLQLASFQFGEPTGASASASAMMHGFEFRSGDGRQLFRSRRDGFSFHRLAPYTKWDHIRSEARKLWN